MEGEVDRIFHFSLGQEFVVITTGVCGTAFKPGFHQHFVEDALHEGESFLRMLPLDQRFLSHCCESCKRQEDQMLNQLKDEKRS